MKMRRWRSKVGGRGGSTPPGHSADPAAGTGARPAARRHLARGTGVRAAAAVCVLGLALAACGSSKDSGTGGDGKGGDAKATLTVYTGQHEQTVRDLADRFTAQTGVKVNLRPGDDAELANQIIEEGSSSPADLYVSEEPGPIGLLDSKHLLAPVTPGTLAQVDARLVPSTRNWMPYAARERVMYFDPKLINESDLPASILDLADPKWKGKFAYAPSGAFTSTVSYLISSIGEKRTLDWLKAIKANGVNEQKNGRVRDSVEAGQHPFGLSNHYYWWQLAQEKGGPDKLTSKVHSLDHPDAGSLVLASGAGVLRSSKHQAEAQQFLAWLGSPDGGQQVIAASTPQYPVAPGVRSTLGLQPLADLKAPEVDQSVFADTSKAKDLIIRSGIS